MRQLNTIFSAVLVTTSLLTSAVDIVTIAGHHELLQVGAGPGGGHHGVTPGLASHAAPGLTGELHQLNIIRVTPCVLCTV